MIQFAVVRVNDDLVQCIGVYTNLYEAVGRAYMCSSDLVDDSEDGKGSVTPLFALEGETGTGLKVYHGENLETNIYILRLETNYKEVV